mmetsp:Transcript_35176/g.57505  ORF Transcript_35176/g.57505 Transcript_35176/m.57505 type:complete len:486 (+) Transcript_35176:366-1823(+)
MNVIEEYSLNDAEEEEYNLHDYGGVPRRNTVDRMIEEHDKQNSASATAHIPISEQETRIIAPGSSPLPQLDDAGHDTTAAEDTAMRTAIKRRLKEQYQTILAESAKQVNSSIHYDDGDLKLININGRMQSTEDEADDDDDDDDDDEDGGGPPDIYGQPSPPQQPQRYKSHNEKEVQHNRNKSSVSSRHSTVSSINSDGYLELSDTLKVSKAEFAAALNAQNQSQNQTQNQNQYQNHTTTNRVNGVQLNEINEHTSVQFSDGDLTQLQQTELMDKEESPTPSTTATITPSDAQYHSDASQTAYNQKPIIHKRRNESFDVMADIGPEPHSQNQLPNREDADHEAITEPMASAHQANANASRSPEVHKRNATTVVHVPDQLKNAAAAQQSEPDDVSDTESVEILHVPNFGDAKERGSVPYEATTTGASSMEVATYPSEMQPFASASSNNSNAVLALAHLNKADSIVSEHGTHYITYNDSNSNHKQKSK